MNRESAWCVNPQLTAKAQPVVDDRSPADIAISVTGVLGPDPDEDGNPAGLVYFAVCRRGQVPIAVERNYDGSDPDAVRCAAIIQALEMLRQSASG
jgi:nicotinamide mononucleotide (NMN) deamidase PncC